MNSFGKSCWCNANISLFFLKEENTIHTKGYMVTNPKRIRTAFTVILTIFFFIYDSSYSFDAETLKDNQVKIAVITNNTNDNADA